MDENRPSENRYPVFRPAFGQPCIYRLCEKRISGNPGRAGGDDRLFVVTTIFPYYDFVRQIGGDRVRLNLVVPAGMDSHSFEPTPADMITIQKADLMICKEEPWSEGGSGRCIP